MANKECVFSNMQVLKPEIRSGILCSAKELFLEHGFEKTTMRDISEAMQMSVSNLYKYFKNKDSLFEALVSDYASMFYSGMSRELSHNESEEFDPARIKKMVAGFAKAIQSDYKMFIILMERSEGSPYQNYKSRCATLLVQHTMESIPQSRAMKVRDVVEILISNLFSAFSELAIRYRSSDQLQPNLLVLFQYHMTGFQVLAKR